MYEFLDRLSAVVFPRVRDFKGLAPSSFDGRGNYTIGLKDQLVFPEIDYTRVDKIKGMNITITTSARNDEEGRELLKLLGVPFRAQDKA
jgi:large subunit ribosomal protein L5